MSNPEKITLRKVKDILIVQLPAALSADTKEDFDEKVEYALADTPGVLILDFAKVTSADAAGVKSLDFAFMRCEEIDTPLIMAAVADSIRPALEAAGYLKRGEESATADEAVQANL
ncbi:MAG TPA: STAS domain-containing protein [Candidatus Eisenbacteria bacterium]